MLESYRKFFTEEDRKTLLLNVEFIDGMELEICNKCGRLVFAGRWLYVDDTDENPVSIGYCEKCHDEMYKGREDEWIQKCDDYEDCYYATTGTLTLDDFILSDDDYSDIVPILAKLEELEADGIEITWSPDGMDELLSCLRDGMDELRSYIKNATRL